MALIQIQNIEVLDNPARFTADFQFKIRFECLAPGIEDELDWKLIYVGSAESHEHDQELDSVLVGPVPVGTMEFVFGAPPPDPSKIPNKDLVAVTVILITCSYREKEFLRIGYYVNNDYGDNAALNENPPEQVVVEELWRNILVDQPRLTRFPIKWRDGDVEEKLPESVTVGHETITAGDDEKEDEEDEGDMEDEEEGDEDDDDEEIDIEEVL